jgi:hypothetical protein
MEPTDEKPAVKNLGWGNDWWGKKDSEAYQMVCRCQGLGHKPQRRNLDRTHHGLNTEYRCDICGYVYHIDSSG